MLKTCQQLPARSWANPGCQLGCPGPVGGRGAGGEPLPPINPEQSPRESSDLSPDCLTWLLSPKTFGSGGSGAVAGGNPQGSAGTGAAPRNLLRVPEEGWDPRGTPGQGCPPCCAPLPRCAATSSLRACRWQLRRSPRALGSPAWAGTHARQECRREGNPQPVPSRKDEPAG